MFGRGVGVNRGRRFRKQTLHSVGGMPEVQGTLDVKHMIFTQLVVEQKLPEGQRSGLVLSNSGMPYMHSFDWVLLLFFVLAYPKII